MDIEVNTNCNYLINTDQTDRETFVNNNLEIFAEVNHQIYLMGGLNKHIKAIVTETTQLYDANFESGYTKFHIEITGNRQTIVKELKKIEQAFTKAYNDQDDNPIERIHFNHVFHIIRSSDGDPTKAKSTMHVFILFPWSA